MKRNALQTEDDSMAQIQRKKSKSVYYEDFGDGSAALVLIHAWDLSCRGWDSNTAALVQAGFHVISVDATGCGRSDKDFEVMTLKAVAENVIAIIGEAKVDKVVLNGWSFGGAVAVLAAKILGAKCTGLNRRRRSHFHAESRVA